MAGSVACQCPNPAAAKVPNSAAIAAYRRPNTRPSTRVAKTLRPVTCTSCRVPTARGATRAVIFFHHLPPEPCRGALVTRPRSTYSTLRRRSPPSCQWRPVLREFPERRGTLLTPAPKGKGAAPTVGPRARACTRPLRSRGVTPVGTPAPRTLSTRRRLAASAFVRSEGCQYLLGIPSSGLSTREATSGRGRCHDTD